VENQRTGGDAVVETLAAHGIRHVFGIPGVHNLAIYDALLQAAHLSRPPAHIPVRHEQSAVYAADGYARATGRPGVALVTSGPGALNALAALNEAACSDVPVLLVASQIHSSLLGAGRGALHEMKDQAGALRAVIDHVSTVAGAGEIPARLGDAFRWMSRGYRRPAAVEIPNDLLAGPCAAKILPEPAEPPLQPSARAIEAALGALRESRYPAILAGGGVAHAEAAGALELLASRLGAPVITTSASKGIVPSRHPLHAGVLAAGGMVEQILSNADLLIAIGTRISHRDLRRMRAKPPDAMIHVDPDPGAFNRTWIASQTIESDAGEFLRALLEGLGPEPQRDPRPAIDRLRELRRLQHDRNRAREPLAIEFMIALAGALGEEGILAADQTVLGYWAELYYPCEKPRTFLYPAGSGVLGYALPAALGARVALPDRRVAVVIGDGGFHFTGAEFGALVQCRLGIPVIVFNDNQYGVIRYLQAQTYHRSGEVDLTNPDFPELARAYGGEGARVSEAAALRAAMEDAFARDVPTLIEVPCSLVPPW
jgi:acetolactate synthase-1/2/3 large subunit